MLVTIPMEILPCILDGANVLEPGHYLAIQDNAFALTHGHGSGEKHITPRWRYH